VIHVFHHIPVMLEECLAGLALRPGGTYVDCTLGGGGHSRAISRAIGPGGLLIGVDRDEAAIQAAIADNDNWVSSTMFFHGNYDCLTEFLSQAGVDGVDGVLFDLGVSSHQLDTGERGFSYHQDAPLDMRMDRRISTTAADLVNNLDHRQLSKIIWQLGEERWADRIARFIVEQRAKHPITTTGQLVEVIKAAVPAGARREGPHPARRTFQALRIAINDELGSLERGLRQAVKHTRPGGRICVISFHSLEDRLIKQTFRSMAGHCTCPADFPQCVCSPVCLIRVVTSKPVLPSREEIENNPRARSAKLRIAERVFGF